MKKEVYGLITFRSTNYALGAEEVLREGKIYFKTIPTPRELSHTCGLAILSMPDDLDRIKEYIEAGEIIHDSLYIFTKENYKNKAVKIF